MNLKYLLFCFLTPIWGYGQFTEITFDDTNNLDLIMIDTVSNPNNIWQIGKPQKSFFNSAYSDPKVMITDSMNSYPINDTSSFYLWYTRIDTTWEFPALTFRYKVDSDSINDFGEILVSRDKGITWYQVGDNESSTYIQCGGCANTVNAFTGRVYSGWVLIHIWSTLGGITPDSTLFKFTFYSDSLENNREGWLIDNFVIEDYPISIRENKKIDQINITPNPAQETIRIHFLDPNIQGQQELKIYSITGQLVLHKMIYPPESEINIKTLKSGVYIYNIGDHRGKIVVE